MPQESALRWRSAVPEGLAVLVAILLAFGIQAWWDVRRDRAEEAGYLSAVRTELEANLLNISEDLDSLAAWTALSRHHLETVAAAGTQPSYADVAEMIFRTGPQVPPPLEQAALDDLVSSGGFQVIRSAELRRALAAYQRALNLDALEAQEVRDYFTGPVREYHIRAGSFSELQWEEYVRVDSTSVSFPLDLTAFTGSRTYANILVVRMLGFSNLRDTREELEDRIEDALNLISGAF